MSGIEAKIINDKLNSLNKIGKLNYSIEIKDDSIKSVILYGKDKSDRLIITKAFESPRELFYYISGMRDYIEGYI